jgi:peroxidase
MIERNLSNWWTPRRGMVLFGLLVAFLLVAGPGVLAAQVSSTEATPEAELDPDQELRDLVDEVEPVRLSSTTNEEAALVRAAPLAVTGGPPYPTGGTGAPTRLIRVAPSAYWDGISTLAGQNRLSAREISNIVLSQSGSVLSAKKASDMVWQWGQFVDHDVDLSESHSPTEVANIPVPLGDPFFDPTAIGGQVIPFVRSIYDPTTGTGLGNPRQQLNEISGLIDGTNIYGQDPARTLELRTLDGTGHLKNPGGFLPYNVNGFPNAQPPGSNPADFFLAGDIRANEQLALTAMHTLWVREHNRTADYVKIRNKKLTGDEIFETARKIVIAELQVITYKEFLPMILGSGALTPYTGFDPTANPGIANVFSTAFYRLGHTMLSPNILRLDPSGNPIPQGPLALRDAFFTPNTLITEGGLEPILKGLSSQVMQRIDSLVVDDVRNFLFGDPLAGGLDLGSLNIQRGRDHGLPDYNTFRIAYGLTPAASFADISSDPVVQNRLATAYTNVNDIDVWVGALAEDPLGPGILVGELLYAGLVDQFERQRDGDPTWWEINLSPSAKNLAKNQTLAKVILRNTTLLPSQLQHNVFEVP